MEPSRASLILKQNLVSLHGVWNDLSRMDQGMREIDEAVSEEGKYGEHCRNNTCSID
jgi:hypothetical protein